MRAIYRGLAALSMTMGLACYGTAAAAPSHGAFILSPASSSAFRNVPFLPRCMKIAVKQGDPRRGASVLLARIDSGCLIPWHWHTANTRLLFVSGRGTHMMKGDRAAADVRGGDFIYLPARQVHAFRCTSTCLVYNITDALDAVHWIDRSGRDIPASQAFASSKP